MLAANQDNTGSQGVTQSSSAIIRTTSESDLALQIMIGGSGDGKISLLQVGTASGAIHITAGGSILDNLSSENANLVAHTAVLNAGLNIGGVDDLNTDVAVLWGSAAGGSMNLNELNDIQLGSNLGTLISPDFRNLVAPHGSITVHAGGLIHIQDGSFLQSLPARTLAPAIRSSPAQPAPAAK